MIFPYLVVLVMFLFGGGERLWEVVEIKGAVREKEVALCEVQSRKTELEEEKHLATDPSILQEKMRQLGYIYPGETVYLGAD